MALALSEGGRIFPQTSIAPLPGKSPLGRVLGAVVKAAVVQPASDAYWSVTHPIDRLRGRGRAANPQMEVPWVAGRPWFHGSPRTFMKPEISNADPSGMYGPAHYITESPQRASEYAMERGLQAGANVTRYAFAPRRVYDVGKAASKQDIKRLMRGIVDAAKRDPSAPQGLTYNASAKLLAKGWGSSPSLDAVYADLAERFGKPFANAAIRRAGYDAISFMEGGAGGIPRSAMAVLTDRALVRGGQPKR